MGVQSLFATTQVKESVIIESFQHNDIFDGNTGLLLEIDHYKMVYWNNSIIFHVRYLFKSEVLDIFMKYPINAQNCRYIHCQKMANRPITQKIDE